MLEAEPPNQNGYAIAALAFIVAAVGFVVGELEDVVETELTAGAGGAFGSARGMIGACGPAGRAGGGGDDIVCGGRL